MDTEKIKKALDNFEDDDFRSAKTILKGEIVQARNNMLQKKLGLQTLVQDREEEIEVEEIDDEEVDDDIDDDGEEERMKMKRRVSQNIRNKRV